MADDTPASNARKSVDFSVPEAGAAIATKRRSSTGKRRSSFFKGLAQSFRRSGGERGADVESLRGTTGPDFEAEAIINRGGPGGCGCMGGSSAKEQLLLIKGPFIFVFGHESDKAPKYAISLAMMKAKPQGGTGGNYLVSLETTLGDVEYEISFKTEGIAKQFVDAVKKQASIGETEQIRKRLGHESLISKRSSVQFAENIALKKVEAQPPNPEPLVKFMGPENQGIPMP